MKHYILDDDKNIVEADLVTWAKWFETADRRVAHDEVNGVKISTVFLGMDHSFNSDGRLILFETMVFDGDLDGEQLRYSSWDEAVAGHKLMVAKVASEA
jgi:hypothetical protein